eukprot:755207-Hanusia_phi.AAC.4
MSGQGGERGIEEFQSGASSFSLILLPHDLTMRLVQWLNASCIGRVACCCRSLKLELMDRRLWRMILGFMVPCRTMFDDLLDWRRIVRAICQGVLHDNQEEIWLRVSWEDIWFPLPCRQEHTAASLLRHARDLIDPDGRWPVASMWMEDKASRLKLVDVRGGDEEMLNSELGRKKRSGRDGNGCHGHVKLMRLGLLPASTLHLKLFQHSHEFLEFAERMREEEEERDEDSDESMSVRILVLSQQDGPGSKGGVYHGQLSNALTLKTHKFNQVVSCLTAALPTRQSARGSFRLYVPSFDMLHGRGASASESPSPSGPGRTIRVRGIDIAPTATFFDACLVHGDSIFYLLDDPGGPCESIVIADCLPDVARLNPLVSLNVPGTMDFSIDLEVSATAMAGELRAMAVSHPRWLLQLGLVSRARGAEEELQEGSGEDQEKPWGPMYVEGFPVPEYQRVFRTGVMGGGWRRGGREVRTRLFVDTLEHPAVHNFSLSPQVNSLLPRGPDERVILVPEGCVRAAELRGMAADRHPALELLRRDVPPAGLTFEEWKDIEMDAAREQSLLCPARLTALNPFPGNDSVRQLEYCPWAAGVLVLGSCEGLVAISHDKNRSSHAWQRNARGDGEEPGEEGEGDEEELRQGANPPCRCPAPHFPLQLARGCAAQRLRRAWAGRWEVEARRGPDLAQVLALCWLRQTRYKLLVGALDAESGLGQERQVRACTPLTEVNRCAW